MFALETSTMTRVFALSDPALSLTSCRTSRYTPRNVGSRPMRL